MTLCSNILKAGSTCVSFGGTKNKRSLKANNQKQTQALGAGAIACGKSASIGAPVSIFGRTVVGISSTR